MVQQKYFIGCTAKNIPQYLEYMQHIETLLILIPTISKRDAKEILQKLISHVEAHALSDPYLQCTAAVHEDGLE